MTSVFTNIKIPTHGIPYNAIASNGSLAIMVGTSMMASTTDGINWASTGPSSSNTWNYICYNGSIFCAIAGFNLTNHVAVSSNGASWTVSSLPTNGWENIAWNGSLFCVTDGQLYRTPTSTNGISWNNNLPELNQLNTTILGVVGSTFIVFGPSQYFTSTNGVTWTPTTSTSLPALNWSSCAYNSSTLIVVSNAQISNIAYSTSNATTWNKVTLPATLQWSNIIWSNNTFIVTDTTSIVATSSNGTTWSIYSALVPWNNYNMSMANINNGLVMMSSSSVELISLGTGIQSVFQSLSASSVTSNGGAFAALSPNNVVTSSKDGITWTNVSVGPTLISMTANGSLFGAISSTIISTSLDAIHWQYHPTPGSLWSYIYSTSGSMIGSGCGSIQAKVFLVASSTMAVTTSNGIVWSSPGSAYTVNPTSAAWNGCVFAICSTIGSALSWSGQYWTHTTFKGTSMTWGSSIFVGINSSISTNTISYSLDGFNWNTTILPTSSYWNAITYNGSLFAVIDNSNNLAISTNGTTWELKNLTYSASWNSIVGNAKSFVAVSNSLTALIQTSY
jgi:hypothetical protein